jgi:hypothetical protein
VTPRRSLSWRSLVAAVVVAAALGGIVGFAVARVTDGRRWPELVFTSEKWRAVAPEERFVFWRDLDRRGLLLGKTHDEILQLLGQPDSDAPDRRRVTYVVKAAEGEYNFNFIYFLDIRFDEAGRVTSAAIGAD